MNKKKLSLIIITIVIICSSFFIIMANKKEDKYSSTYYNLGTINEITLYNINKNDHSASLINNGQYPITAQTSETGYYIRDHFTYGQEEVKYINLGLYEREQPDAALLKDIENVRVGVNGYQHVYEYAQRFLNQGEYGDGFNVGVKFGNKYGTMSYTRAIYKADVEYTNANDKSKELKVYIEPYVLSTAILSIPG